MIKINYKLYYFTAINHFIVIFKKYMLKLQLLYINFTNIERKVLAQFTSVRLKLYVRYTHF